MPILGTKVIIDDKYPGFIVRISPPNEYHSGRFIVRVHYKYYTEKEWKDVDNYDICINSDVLGVEKAAEMICGLLETRKVKN